MGDPVPDISVNLCSGMPDRSYRRANPASPHPRSRGGSARIPRSWLQDAREIPTKPRCWLQNGEAEEVDLHPRAAPAQAATANRH